LCWGEEAVDAVISGNKVKECSGSVFAAFAQRGNNLLTMHIQMMTFGKVIFATDMFFKLIIILALIL